MKSYPVNSFNLTQFFQEFAKLILSIQIKPISCCILSYNNKLFYTIFCKLPCFFNDIFNCAASVFSPTVNSEMASAKS